MIAPIGTTTSTRSSPRATAVCCSLAGLGAALISAHLLMTLFEGKPAEAGYSLASAGATNVALAPESEAVTLMPRSDPLFAPAVETEDTAPVPIRTETITRGAPATVPLPRPRPVPGSHAARTDSGTAETGLGSYYQPTTTACGGPIDPHALTAAHKSLPCGTRVKVTNAKNGRYAMVQITDRGPFIRGRVIDLNQAAARDLDMIGAGVVPVRVEVVR